MAGGVSLSGAAIPAQRHAGAHRWIQGPQFSDPTGFQNWLADTQAINNLGRVWGNPGAMQDYVAQGGAIAPGGTAVPGVGLAAMDAMGSGLGFGGLPNAYPSQNYQPPSGQDLFYGGTPDTDLPVDLLTTPQHLVDAEERYGADRNAWKPPEEAYVESQRDQEPEVAAAPAPAAPNPFDGMQLWATSAADPLDTEGSIGGFNYQWLPTGITPAGYMGTERGPQNSWDQMNRIGGTYNLSTMDLSGVPSGYGPSVYPEGSNLHMNDPLYQAMRVQGLA